MSGPFPGSEGPLGTPAGILNAEGAWRNLMLRIGYRIPNGIKSSSKMLDEVDRINGKKSTAYPF